MNQQIISLMSMVLGAVLVNNLILGQMLGIGPFLEASGSMRRAAGMGGVLTLLMGLTAAVCWPLNEYLLVRAGLEHMGSVGFLLTAVFLVQVMEMLLRKLAPARWGAMGSSLPLFANCAVMGVVLQNVQNGYGFAESVTYAAAGGLGFLLITCLFVSLRERLEFAECPKAFEGFPIALVTAGLLALCFTGFSNLTVFG